VLTGQIAEYRILPFIGWEIPSAGARFVIIAAIAVVDGRVFAVIHYDLKKRPVRNFGANVNCTSIESTRRQSSLEAKQRRSATHDRTASQLAARQHPRLLEPEWIVRIRTESGESGIKPVTNLSAIIIEDYVFAIDSACQLSSGDFHASRFVSSDSRVRNGNSPQHG
jgi:hypothetical protein